MRKIFSSFLTFGLLTVSASANASVGFVTGNEFQATYLEGEVSVTCQDGLESATARYRCGDQVLDPAEFVKFRGPRGLDADTIVLLATRADGTQREKSEGYDPQSGLSNRAFNLWISTLFQRPLLKKGANRIDYSFQKAGKTVLGGSLMAQVREGRDRFCRSRHYFSQDMSDCRSGENLCVRYFQDENYCQ